MRGKFGKDLAKNIAEEVRENYPPYVDKRFGAMQQKLQRDGLILPYLEDDFEENMEKKLARNFLRELRPFEEMPLEVPSGLELWYNGYLIKCRDQESNSTENE